MPQRYGEYQDGVQKYWSVERLWRLSESLPVENIAIDKIQGPDEVTWFSFDGPLPTCRAIAEHCKRINEVDLSYPILLTEDFKVFDGMHRIARCIMEGKTHIQAKRFLEDPEPDEYIEFERESRDKLETQHRYKE
ncbi:chromosome partitioning protein ParB [Chloroflexi bacterium TSY]|nr:chromosome partitioning protein ParB [Chloroflexi bacterium TSY]